MVTALTISLNTVKNYIRVSHTLDDVYISGLIDIAKTFIYEQTGVTFTPDDEVYKLAILLMVGNYYDNRVSVSDKSVSELPYSMDYVIKHLGNRGALDAE